MSKFDWEAIHSDYRTGQHSSVRAISYSNQYVRLWKTSVFGGSNTSSRLKQAFDFMRQITNS